MRTVLVPDVAGREVVTFGVAVLIGIGEPLLDPAEEDPPDDDEPLAFPDPGVVVVVLVAVVVVVVTVDAGSYVNRFAAAGGELRPFSVTSTFWVPAPAGAVATI